MEKLTHVHLTVNARINPSFSALQREKASAFVKDLMKITNMKPLGLINFAEADDLDFPGQSFVQMITTSHTSLHYFSDTHEIYFDLYSCKDFESESIIKLLDRYFGIVEWHGVLYSRSLEEKPVVMVIGSAAGLCYSAPTIR